MPGDLRSEISSGPLRQRLFERYVAIGRWAALAGGSVRLAVVARAEMIDAGKFGVIVARNRSLVAEIFTSEAEAAAWLDAPDAHGRRGSKA